MLANFDFSFTDTKRNLFNDIANSSAFSLLDNISFNVGSSSIDSKVDNSILMGNTLNNNNSIYNKRKSLNQFYL